MRARSIAPDGEAGIEAKSGLDFGSRFIEPPKLHQRRSHIETSGSVVWVQFVRPTTQVECLVVSAKVQLGEGDISYPNSCIRVVGTDAQGLKFMALSFLGMTVEDFRETNLRVRVSQIRIQRQRPLTFGNALGPAIGLEFGPAHQEMRQRVVRRLR